MRKCSNCGWEYGDGDYARMKCRWCGTYLPTQVCGTCGRTLPLSEMSKCDKVHYVRRCKRCSVKLSCKISAQHTMDAKVNKLNTLEQLEGIYKDTVDRVSNAQAKNLTEGQWYETVKRFGGCAICGDPIVNRSLIVPPTLGGKYAQHNVLPLCEKHSDLLFKDKNPYVAMHPLFNKGKTTEEEYKRFVDSIQIILEGLNNE